MARQNSRSRRGRPLHETCRVCLGWVCRVWVLVLGNLIVLALALLLVAHHRPIPLGGFVLARAEARLQGELAPQGLRLDIGAAELVLQDGLVPVFFARDLQLRQTGTQDPLARLESLRLSFHRGALARGQIRLRSIGASAPRIRLIRGSNRLSVDLDRAELVAPVESPGALIAALDGLFDQPVLSEVETVTLTDIDLRLEDHPNGWLWHSRDGAVRLLRHDAGLTMAATFSELTEGHREGSLSLTVHAQPEAQTARIRLAGRGLSPSALVLPEAGGRLTRGMFGHEVPVNLDLAGTVLPGGDLGTLTGRIALGAGQIPLGRDKTLALHAAASDLTLFPDTLALRLNNIDLKSDLIALAGTANLQLRETPLGVLRGADLQLSLTDVALAQALGFEAPVSLSHLETLALYDMPGARVTLGQSWIVTEDATLALSGYLQMPSSPKPMDDARSSRRSPLPEGWSAALDLAADTVDSAALRALWPRPVLPATRRWISSNLHQATLEQPRLALRLAEEGPMETGLSLRFSDAALRVDPGLPVFQSGVGALSLFDRRLDVQLDRARLPLAGVPDVDITGAHVTIPDLRPEHPVLSVNANVRAGVPSALRLLSEPLINVAPPVSPDTTSGQAEMALSLSLPLRAGPEGKVTWQAQGQIHDLASTTLVPDMDLQAEALDIAVTRQKLAISGSVRVDGLPVAIRFDKALGPEAAPGEIAFEAPLTWDLATRFGLPLRRDQMRGTGRAEGTIRLGEGAPELDLRADLTGVGLRLASLGWRKSESSSGQFALTGRLGAAPSFPRLRISAPGFEGRGRLRVAPSGQLDRLEFDTLRIGRWFQGTLALRSDGGNALALDLGEGRIDLRHLPETGGGGGDSPVSVVSLFGSDVVLGKDLRLSQMIGTLDVKPGAGGMLRGRVNGGAPVSVRLAPTAHGPRLLLRAPDAGAAVRDAGLFTQGNGGKGELILVPMGEKGSYRGRIGIDDITLVEAPAVASLLSAVSIIGIAEQLGTGGLHFGRVEAEFLLTPDAVVVSEASAAGPSLGLSLDGHVNLTEKTMDMQGVVSPFFFVNRLLSGLTPKGEGAIGIVFRMEGPFDSPRTRANPLSVLTPGLFRDVFRKGSRPELPPLEETGP